MVLSFLVSFGLLIVAMTVHEFAHGFAAFRLGDNTAKHSGRLTLNPLAHIDPIWTFLMPLFLFVSTHGQFVFGAAKPVPINYWSLRNPKRDIIWIGLAGPLTNLIFALFLSLFIKFMRPESVFNFLIQNLIAINVVLGVFNLVPIPPLDGSRILMGLLPQNLAKIFSRVEPFAFIILIVLMFTGVINAVIWPVITVILGSMGVNL